MWAQGEGLAEHAVGVWARHSKLTWSETPHVLQHTSAFCANKDVGSGRQHVCWHRQVGPGQQSPCPNCCISRQLPLS